MPWGPSTYDPNPQDQKIADHNLRRVAAHHIADRTAQFNPSTIDKHPVTVAQIVASPIPTVHLHHIAAHLDEAWHAAHQYQVQKFMAQRTPMTLANQQHDMSLDHLAEALHVKGQTTLAQGYLDYKNGNPMTAEEKAALQAYGGSDNPAFVYGMLEQQALHPGAAPGSLINTVSEKYPGSVQTAAQPFMALPLGAGALQVIGTGFLMGGAQAGARLGIKPLEVAGQWAQEVWTKAIRTGEMPLVIAAGGIEQAAGKNVQWDQMLHFWDSGNHDPLTYAFMNASGLNPDDPAHQKAAQTLDFGIQLVGTVIAGQALARGGEYLMTPAEAGGAFSAETWAKSPFGRIVISRAAATFAEVPEDQRVGQILAKTQNADPKLASLLADAFKAGGGVDNMRGARAAMGETFVDYVNGNADHVSARLTAVNNALSAGSGDVATLSAEKVSLERQLEMINQRSPQYKWPSINDVKGVIKGAPPTTRTGRLFDSLYSHKGVDLNKFVDNLREKPQIWLPGSRADWADLNAATVGKEMRMAGVDTGTIATRIGEMMNLKPGDMYSWWDRVTSDIVDKAKGNVDPATLDRIEHSFRNAEIFQTRATIPEQLSLPDGRVVSVRRKMLETPEGHALPTQENENVGSFHAPSVSDVKEATSWVRAVQRRGGTPVALVRKLVDVGMGFTRSVIIAAKAPAINPSIQTEERLGMLFNGFRNRGVQRVLAKVIFPGGVPVSTDMSAVQSVADHLGLADVAEAQAIYKSLPRSDIGQIITDGTAEGLRTEVPATDFNARFMSGATSTFENNKHFGSLQWELQHLNQSDMVRSLVTDGVDTTANNMLGGRPGTSAVPEGSVRVWTETPAKNVEGIKSKGLLPNGRTNEGGPPAVWFSTSDLSQQARQAMNGQVPPGMAIVEAAVPYSDLHFNGATQLNPTIDELNAANNTVQTYRPVTPDEILGVHTAAGAPLSDHPLAQDYLHQIKPNLDMSNLTGSERDRLVAHLQDKMRQVNEVTGGNPALIDAVGSGTWNNMADLKPRLAEEMGHLQHELDQVNMTLGDSPHPAMARMLEERKVAILDRLDQIDLTRGSHSIDIADTGAMSKALQAEALKGNYDLPPRAFYEVPETYASSAEGYYRHGFIRKMQSTIYGAMKWMNKDIPRGGMWTDRYLHWKDALIKNGWTAEDAGYAATARASFDVRDWMHDIGNKSSFQRSLRNEVPFLHAWERVAYRWMFKLPERIGGGMGALSLPVGWSLEAKALSDFQGFVNSAWGRTVIGPDGKKQQVIIAPNPLHLANAIPGINFSDKLTISDWKHGLLPLRILSGELPGLSPVASFALGEAGKVMPLAKQLNDRFTLNGSFTTQFPGIAQVTRVYEAVTGQPPPWSIGQSRRYQDYIVGRAHDGALRMAYTQLANQGVMPPNPADYKDPATYNAVRDQYWQRLNSTANEYFHGNLFMNLVSSESMVSFSSTTKEEAAWKQFLAENNITGKRTPADYALIEKYLGDHPSSLGYNVSMYDRQSKFPTQDGWPAFRDAIAKGDVKLLGPSDYRAAIALSQEWEFYHTDTAQGLAKAGLSNWNKMSAQNQLLNYGAYKEATAQARLNFDQFLASDLRAKQLYDKYASPGAKAFDQVQQIEQNRKDLLAAGKNPDLMEQQVWNSVPRADYGTTTAQHVEWYRSTVMQDYYKKLDPIYAQIDKVKGSGDPNSSAQLAALYDQIRNVNDSYTSIKAPDGTKYPTPEAYAFSAKSPADQKAKIAEWATQPTAWLSTFAYTKTFGDITPQQTQYLDYEKQVVGYFNQKTAGLSTSSNAYASLQRWESSTLDRLANSLGAQNIRALESATPIVRLQAAGVLPTTPTSTWMVQQAQAVADQLKARGVSLWSTSAEAVALRARVEQGINLMRDPNSQYYNRALDQWWSQETLALGYTDTGALYRQVLWGIEPSFKVTLDFSAEDQLAAKGA